MPVGARMAVRCLHVSFLLKAGPRLRQEFLMDSEIITVLSVHKSGVKFPNVFLLLLFSWCHLKEIGGLRA